MSGGSQPTGVVAIAGFALGLPQSTVMSFDHTAVFHAGAAAAVEVVAAVLAVVAGFAGVDAVAEDSAAFIFSR